MQWRSICISMCWIKGSGLMDAGSFQVNDRFVRYCTYIDHCDSCHGLRLG